MSRQEWLWMCFALIEKRAQCFQYLDGCWNQDGDGCRHHIHRMVTYILLGGISYMVVSEGLRSEKELLSFFSLLWETTPGFCVQFRFNISSRLEVSHGLWEAGLWVKFLSSVPRLFTKTSVTSSSADGPNTLPHRTMWGIKWPMRTQSVLHGSWYVSEKKTHREQLQLILGLR